MFKSPLLSEEELEKFTEKNKNVSHILTEPTNFAKISAAYCALKNAYDQMVEMYKKLPEENRIKRGRGYQQVFNFPKSFYKDVSKIPELKYLTKATINRLYCALERSDICHKQPGFETKYPWLWLSLYEIRLGYKISKKGKPREYIYNNKYGKLFPFTRKCYYYDPEQDDFKNPSNWDYAPIEFNSKCMFSIKPDNETNLLIFNIVDFS